MVNQAALIATVVALSAVFYYVNMPKGPSMLEYYAHVASQPPNATLIVVATASGDLKQRTFGTVFAFDNKLTEGPESDSTVIGNMQGLLVVGKGRPPAPLYMNFAVNLDKHPKYKGSLALQGFNDLYVPKREIAVTGGTEDFKYARGVLISETVVSKDQDAQHTIYKWTAFLKY